LLRATAIHGTVYASRRLLWINISILKVDLFRSIHAGRLSGYRLSPLPFLHASVLPGSTGGVPENRSGARGRLHSALGHPPPPRRGPLRAAVAPRRPGALMIAATEPTRSARPPPPAVFADDDVDARLRTESARLYGQLPAAAEPPASPALPSRAASPAPAEGSPAAAIGLRVPLETVPAPASARPSAATEAPPFDTGVPKVSSKASHLSIGRQQRTARSNGS
jgi:hypothetical protein